MAAASKSYRRHKAPRGPRGRLAGLLGGVQVRFWGPGVT